MRVGLLVDITEPNWKEKIHQAKEMGFDFGQLANWNMDFYTDENLKELKAKKGMTTKEVANAVGMTEDEVKIIFTYFDQLHRFEEKLNVL